MIDTKLGFAPAGMLHHGCVLHTKLTGLKARAVCMLMTEKCIELSAERISVIKCGFLIPCTAWVRKYQIIAYQTLYSFNAGHLRLSQTQAGLVLLTQAL